jgi:tRNA-Thr(GGU) m(6)t(6)A37 methyltransferase TsaA
MRIEYSPIGFVRSPFKVPEGVPIQTKAGNDIQGEIEILDEYVPGLSDLDGFSHIIVLTHLHAHDGYKLMVTPFLDEVERGVFSTRAPRRPNPIGFHLVRLRAVDGNTLKIMDIDMIDGTPVLDIKPYIPQGDEREECNIGWLEGKLKRFLSEHSDDRFNQP